VILAVKQFKESLKQRKLQPQMAEIQRRFKDAVHEMSRKLQELQRLHGINPMSAVLPGVVQAPFLYAVYRAVGVYQYHFLQGRFLWIGSAWSVRFPLYIGHSLGQFDLLLVVVYALISVACQRVLAGSPNGRAANIMAWFGPAVMALMLVSSHCVSAFVLYWIISIVLSMATQAILECRLGRRMAVAC
jgi:YidC/Oxa1 family membrane protein insertase